MARSVAQLNLDDGGLEALQGGSRHLFLDSRQTAGSVYLVEGLMEPGAAVPPHVHTHEDEIFHVLEGEVELLSDGKWQSGQAGDIIFLPRGIPHAIRVPEGGGAARVLNYVFPGGNFEAMFRAFEERGVGGDGDQRAKVAKEFGVTFL